MQKKTASDAKRLANNDNIKWDVDYRTAVDAITYKRADGTETSNGDLLTSRLILGMGYAPTSNVIFKGALSYNKAFGANPPSDGQTTSFPQRGMGFDTFDWVSNETLADDKLRVKEAYWLYMNDTFMGNDIAWTASVGRRPSTNGFLANLREDDAAKSPIGHAINMEFDGASFKFNLDKVTDVPGMYWKLCLGRGLTNALPRFDMSGGLASNGDYSKSASTMEDIDMKGFIFVPYNDGQYSVETTYFVGTNVPGFNILDMNYLNGLMTNTSTTNTGMLEFQDADNDNMLDSWGFNSAATGLKMKGLGDITGSAISFKTDGIGDGINDFLDSTIFFASYAQSKTDPDNKSQVLDMNKVYTAVNQMVANNMAPDFGTAFEQMMSQFGTMTDAQKAAYMRNEGMLGSGNSETGNSIYLGAQMPCPLTEDGRVGVEWNKGSKYWRSFTYGEDTLAGSKLATRGTAWEIYYTKPLLPALSFQVRYTKMNYDYTGSQGFFGDEGTPYTMAEAKAFGMNPIEEATDVRAYIRYRF